MASPTGDVEAPLADSVTSHNMSGSGPNLKQGDPPIETTFVETRTGEDIDVAKVGLRTQARNTCASSFAHPAACTMASCDDIGSSVAAALWHLTRRRLADWVLQTM